MNESELRCIINKVNEVCKVCGMEMNSKKTKTMIFSKMGNIQCNITVSGETLEQVSWLTEDGRCDLEIKTRIGIAKDAFWKHKDLLKGNISLKTKKRILYCYSTRFLVLKYACESWTINNDLIRRIIAFEQWCYRRILKIKVRRKI